MSKMRDDDDDRPRDEMTMTAPRWVFQVLVWSTDRLGHKSSPGPLRQECLKASRIARDQLGSDFSVQDDTQGESDETTVEVGEMYRLKNHGDVYVYDLSRSIESATADGVVDEDIIVAFRPENDHKETLRELEISKFIDEGMK